MQSKCISIGFIISNQQTAFCYKAVLVNWSDCNTDLNAVILFQVEHIRLSSNVEHRYACAEASISCTKQKEKALSHCCLNELSTMVKLIMKLCAVSFCLSNSSASSVFVLAVAPYHLCLSQQQLCTISVGLSSSSASSLSVLAKALHHLCLSQQQLCIISVCPSNSSASSMFVHIY